MAHLRNEYPTEELNYSNGSDSDDYPRFDLKVYMVDSGWVHMQACLNEEGLDVTFYFQAFDDRDDFGLDYEPELSINHDTLELHYGESLAQQLVKLVFDYDTTLI